jgi:hypothetical protein
MLEVSKLEINYVTNDAGDQTAVILHTDRVLSRCVHGNQGDNRG